MLPSSARASRRRNRSIAFSHVVAFWGGISVATLLMTLFQGTILHANRQSDRFAGDQLALVASPRSAKIAPAPPDVDVKIRMADDHHSTHGVAGLDCASHGGPNTAEATQELVYWRDLPLDNEYVAPLRSTTVRQYLTFEPDGGEFQGRWTHGTITTAEHSVAHSNFYWLAHSSVGGWNNIRMSMVSISSRAFVFCINM